MAMESLRAQCCSISHVLGGESIKYSSNSTTLAGYGSIKSIGAQPLLSTVACHKDENIVRIERNMTLFDDKRVSTLLSQFMGWSPIPLDVSRATRLVSPLVSGSARFSRISRIPRK